MGQQQILLAILGVIIVGIAIAVGISMFTTERLERETIREFHIKPELLQPRVLQLIPRSPIGLRIAISYEGHIETDFEEHTGRETGVWIFKTRWDERSKYIIDISYKWEKDSMSVLKVVPSIEERENINYPWKKKESSEEAWDRAIQIVAVIDSSIKK